MCLAKQTHGAIEQFFYVMSWLPLSMCVENEGFSANHWSNLSFELHVVSAIIKQNIFFMGEPLF